MKRHVLVLGTACIAIGAACRKQEGAIPPESAAAGAIATATSEPTTPAVPRSDSATTAASSAPLPARPSGLSVSSTGVKTDTLRGTVERVGNDPVSVLVLRATGTSAQNSYSLRSANRALLEHVTGLEIVVNGALTTERDMQAAPRGAPVFDVRTFEVRAADGVAAIDGVVNVDNGVYFLRTSSGQRLEIPHLPAELRKQVGARVFLAGPLTQPPSAYGVIAAKP